jgi:hypothetical protein
MREDASDFHVARMMEVLAILLHPKLSENPRVIPSQRAVDRSHLLEPSADYGQRKMAWVPPAFSGRSVFARNDKELVCASLASSSTNAAAK